MGPALWPQRWELLYSHPIGMKVWRHCCLWCVVTATVCRRMQQHMHAVTADVTRTSGITSTTTSISSIRYWYHAMSSAYERKWPPPCRITWSIHQAALWRGFCVRERKTADAARTAAAYERLLMTSRAPATSFSALTSRMRPRLTP